MISCEVEEAHAGGYRKRREGVPHRIRNELGQARGLLLELASSFHEHRDAWLDAHRAHLLARRPVGWRFDDLLEVTPQSPPFLRTPLSASGVVPCMTAACSIVLTVEK